MISDTNIQSELESTGAESFHHTKRNVIIFRHLWQIDDFLLFKKTITSPEFASKKCSDRRWQLSVEKDDSYVQIELELNSPQKANFEYRWDAFLWDAEGKEVHTRTDTDMFDANTDRSLVIKKFIAIADLSDSSKGLLPNGSLRLLSQITMATDSTDTNALKLRTLNSTREDLSNLFDNSLHTDVIFIVDSEELKAHKAILALRSSVFAAMFEHQEMDENKRNRVVITDMDCNVFREFLNFLYSNKSPNIDKMAPELLAAAEKYDIQNLKTLCEYVLGRDMTVNTVIEMLILADRYSAYKLKNRSLSVIKDNISVIALTTEWSNMIANFPHLITEITLYNANK